MSYREITELCPHCEEEITLQWDVNTLGYIVFCPHCGSQLMLCDACKHPAVDEEPNRNCDWNCRTGLCYRCNSKSADIKEVQYRIRHNAYERYKLDWCLSHNKTISDLFQLYSNYWGEAEWETEDEGFDRFIEENGFGGEIWACFKEFLDHEYRDQVYMCKLLPTHVFAEYMKCESFNTSFTT